MSRLAQLLDFLNASPDDSFILFALAKEYEKADDIQNAETYYLRIHNHDPDYIGLYYHLGKLYFRQDRLKEAFDIYTEGMRRAKDQGDQHALRELAGARLEIDEDELD